MKTKIISMLLQFLLSNLDAQFMRELIDDVLDKVEDREQDNVFMMKLISVAREVMGIPDDIGGDED
jgi:hypothetical protein